MYNHMEMALSVLSFVGCFWVASSSVVVDPRNLTVTTGQTIKLRCIFSDTEVNWFSRNGTNNPLRIASSDDNACWKKKPTVDGNNSVYREADDVCVLEVNNLKHNLTYLCISESTPKQDQAVVVVMAPKSSGSDCEVDTATSAKLRCEFDNTEVSWLSRSGINNPIPIAYRDTNACSNEKETVDGNYTVYREAEGVCILEVKNLKQNLTYMCKSNSYKEHDKAITVKVAFDKSSSIGCEIDTRASCKNDTVEISNAASCEQKQSYWTHMVVVIVLLVICVIGLLIVFFAWLLPKLQGFTRQDQETALFINENDIGLSIKAGNLIPILQSITNCAAEAIKHKNKLTNMSMWDYIEDLDLKALRDVDGDIGLCKNIQDIDMLEKKWRRIIQKAEKPRDIQLSLLESNKRLQVSFRQKEALIEDESSDNLKATPLNVNQLWADSFTILSHLSCLARNAWNLYKDPEKRSECEYHKKLYVINKIKGIKVIIRDHWFSCQCEIYSRLDVSKVRGCNAENDNEGYCGDNLKRDCKKIIEDEHQIELRKLESYKTKCICPEEAPGPVQTAMRTKDGVNPKDLYRSVSPVSSHSRSYTGEQSTVPKANGIDTQPEQVDPSGEDHEEPAAKSEAEINLNLKSDP